MPECPHLTKIYRQTDQEFVSILENIRTAKVSDELLKRLNALYSPQPPIEGNLITLTTHIKQADEINAANLQMLSSEEVLMEANIEGDFQLNQYPVPRELRLKIGAQVMLVRNEKGDNPKYFNGKIGRISSISTHLIVIEFEENDHIELQRDIWVNSKLQVDEKAARINATTLGTFEQFPIKLAWAITIHKSQGLTFDGAVIDAGNAFAPGQVYVAFSRLRSLNNVCLRSRIEGPAIRLHPVTAQFEQLATKQVSDHQTLVVSEQAYFKQLLLNGFNWKVLTDILNAGLPLKADILTSAVALLTGEIKHADGFRKVISKFDFIDEPLTRTRFSGRLSKARVHFENKLVPLTEDLKNYIKVNKNDIHHKRNTPFVEIPVPLMPYSGKANKLFRDTLIRLIVSIPKPFQNSSYTSQGTESADRHGQSYRNIQLCA